MNRELMNRDENLNDLGKWAEEISKNVTHIRKQILQMDSNFEKINQQIFPWTSGSPCSPNLSPRLYGNDEIDDVIVEHSHYRNKQMSLMNNESNNFNQYNDCSILQDNEINRNSSRDDEFNFNANYVQNERNIYNNNDYIHNENDLRNRMEGNAEDDENAENNADNGKEELLNNNMNAGNIKNDILKHVNEEEKKNHYAYNTIHSDLPIISDDINNQNLHLYNFMFNQNLQQSNKTAEMFSISTPPNELSVNTFTTQSSPHSSHLSHTQFSATSFPTYNAASINSTFLVNAHQSIEHHPTQETVLLHNTHSMQPNFSSPPPRPHPPHSSYHLLPPNTSPLFSSTSSSSLPPPLHFTQNIEKRENEFDDENEKSVYLSYPQKHLGDTSKYEYEQNSNNISSSRISSPPFPSTSADNLTVQSTQLPSHLTGKSLLVSSSSISTSSLNSHFHSSSTVSPLDNVSSAVVFRNNISIEGDHTVSQTSSMNSSMAQANSFSSHPISSPSLSQNSSALLSNRNPLLPSNSSPAKHSRQSTNPYSSINRPKPQVIQASTNPFAAVGRPPAAASATSTPLINSHSFENA